MAGIEVWITPAISLAGMVCLSMQIESLRKEVAELSKQVAELSKQVSALSERMARLEGRFEGFTRLDRPAASE